MKHVGIASVTAFGLLLGISTFAVAEDSGPKPEELFQKLDKNGDGKLAADEISKEQGKFFDRLVRVGDKDDDGQLSKEEFTQAIQRRNKPVDQPANAGGRQAGRGQFDPKQAFKRMDANGDGKLTLEEAPEPVRDRLRRLFERLGKKSLTLEEFVTAVRQQGGKQGQRPNQSRPQGGGPLIMRKLDTNKDGRLSKQELSAVVGMFGELDTNKDGLLDPRELFGPPPGERDGKRPEGRKPRQQDASGGQFAEQLIKRFDKNGDGKIAKEEAGDRIKENFERIDRNDDGFITAAELKEALNRSKGQRKDGKRSKRKPSK